MDSFAQWRQHAQTRTENLLAQSLPAAAPAPLLHEAMRYSTLDGGKRLRPLLVLAASELGTRCDAACEAAMVAVECIHVYSLIHDDLPAMDNDDLRRGKPTCHIRYGEAFALLAGDALQSFAFARLARCGGSLSAERRLRMVSLLAEASGSGGMAGGQALDLANSGRSLPQSELETMHRLKTGALIRAAAVLGGLSCADVDDAALAALDTYADKLGLAFQVIDDVLDCEADTATLGKTAGKDAAADKATYVKLMGLSAARTYAERLAAEAEDALAAYGCRARRLRELAAFAVVRQH